MKRPSSSQSRRRVGAAVHRSITTVVALVVLGVFAGPASAADAPSSATAVRDEYGETQPLNAPGQTLYLQRVTIPSGLQLVDHFHEGTQIARVVRGVLTYDVISGAVQITRRDGTTETVDGPATVKVRAGESLVEVESLAHAGANRGTKPVVLELTALLATGAPLSSPLGSAAEGTPLTLRSELTSQMTQLTSVGADASVTYGWNRLTGTATDPSGPVAVELLGNVAYDRGVGPFFGFITFTFADGSVLGTQVQGVATKDEDGVTRFASTLGVLDGSGRYVGATGTGTFTGTRDAALGEPVRATFDLTIHAGQ